MAGAEGVMGRVVADENGEEAIRRQVTWGLERSTWNFGFHSETVGTKGF